MRVLILQDDLYQYLTAVVQNYAHSGINPEEGMALYHLNRAIVGAQAVDENQVAKLAIPASAEAPVSLTVEPPAPTGESESDVLPPSSR